MRVAKASFETGMNCASEIHHPFGCLPIFLRLISGSYFGRGWNTVSRRLMISCDLELMRTNLSLIHI